MCPRSLGPFYKITNYIKWVKTSWTYREFIKCNFDPYSYTLSRRVADLNPHLGLRKLVLLIPVYDRGRIRIHMKLIEIHNTINSFGSNLDFDSYRIFLAR